MERQFSQALANASEYPAPHIFVTPKFSLRFFTTHRRSVKHSANITFTRNGRGALGLAGQQLMRNSTNVILVPSYHSPSVVEPFLWLGYQVQFYPINEDLTINLAVLKNAIDQHQATHCIVIRYFGFEQNNNEVIDTLYNASVKVIEDNAHSVFNLIHRSENIDIAKTDATICSLNKILPTIDGGILLSRAPLAKPLKTVDMIEELKGLAFILGIVKVLGKIKGLFTRSTHTARSATIEPEKKMYRCFNPRDIAAPIFRHSRAFFTRSDYVSIAKKRRENFEFLINQIDNEKAGYPLYSSLKENDTPYVLPFVLSHEKFFSDIRNQGIQIFRWEEMIYTSCDISDIYRSRLIQLPCHHQLSHKELNFIASTINQLTP